MAVPTKSASLCEGTLLHVGIVQIVEEALFLVLPRIPSLSYHLAPLCLDRRDQ